MTLDGEYNKAVQKARLLYFKERRPKELRAFYDEYARMLGRISKDMRRGRLNADRAAILGRRIRGRLERFEEIAGKKLGEGVDRVAGDLLSAHAAATDRVITIANVGDRVGLAAKKALLDLPDEIVETMMLRRSLGGARTFKSLMSRPIANAIGDVDDFLTYAVAGGIGGSEAVNELGAIMGRGDPLLGQAIGRVLGAEGRLLRRPLKKLLETPEQFKGLRKLFYEARRIYVTEYNTAYFESDRMASERSTIVDLVQWVLSGRHDGLWSSPDVCDLFEGRDYQGYGPGLYHPSCVPALPHPHCACHLKKVLRPAEEWGEPPRANPYMSYQKINPTNEGFVLRKARHDGRGKRKITKNFVRSQTKIAKEKLVAAHRSGIGRRKALLKAQGFPEDAVPPVRLLIGEKVRQGFGRATEEMNRRTGVLAEKRQVIFDKKDRLFDELADDRITTAEFEKRIKALNEENNDLLRQILEIEDTEAEILRKEILKYQRRDPAKVIFHEEKGQTFFKNKTSEQLHIRFYGDKLAKNKKEAEEAMSFISGLVGDGRTYRSGVGIEWSSGYRSYYSDAYKSIVWKGGHDTPTFVHEFGHFLEYNFGETKAKALVFLEKRKPTGPYKPWDSSLPNELAWIDKFIHPYMGRDYANNATEIISMGIEYLYKDPGRLAELDPEYFDFLMDLFLK